MNSFHPEVKCHILRLEWIRDKIGKLEVSVLFYQTCLKEEMLHINKKGN